MKKIEASGRINEILRLLKYEKRKNHLVYAVGL